MPMSILELVLSLRLLSALIPYHSLVKFKHFSLCLLYVLILARNLNQRPLYLNKNLNSRCSLNSFAELGHKCLCKPMISLSEQVLQASRGAPVEWNSSWDSIALQVSEIYFG